MNSKAATITALLCVLGAVGGCRDSSDGAKFELDGKIFVFNYRVATATYLVNIKSAGPTPDGLAAVVSFENPAGGTPIVVTEKIWPKVLRTTINSPPVFCIVKDRPYAVAIRIEDASGKEVQRIDTTITSSQDQTDLPDKPLVVGPLYTPNPGDVAAPGQPPEKCPG